MQYLHPTFTLPASVNTSLKRWEFAFLSKEEFIRRYRITEEEYEKLKTDGTSLS